MEPTVPPGVVQSGGEWYYTEYARGGGVSNLGGEARPTTSSTRSSTDAAPQPPAAEERNRIMDLFRN
jgi:penicillin-binding protein 1A